MVSEIELTPCIVRRDIELLRMYNQIMCMDHDRIPRAMLTYNEEHGGEWSTSVNNLLGCIGKGEAWEDKTAVNTESAKIELMRMFEEVWQDGIKEKPKLRTYILFKNKFEVEPYLTANLPKWKRSLISQIRCGTLGLQIELGRYSKTPASERTCQLCKSAVQDEFHFLFDCKHYHDECENLYNKVTELRNCRSNKDHFIIINNMPFKFANYIASIWDKDNKSLCVITSN